MTLLDIAKAVMRKGLIVKFVVKTDNKQDNHYYVVAQSKWLKKFKIDCNYPDHEFVDVILDKPINVDTIQPALIEYVGAPENVSIEDLINPSETFKKLGDDFLETNKPYMYKAMKTVLNLKLSFKEYMDYYIENFETDDFNSIKDVYCLRFYPKKISGETKDDVRKELINDLTTKYFTHSAPDFGLPTENALIPALQILGTSTSNIFNIDPDFINAIRNQWKHLINKEKNKMIKDLETQLKTIEKYTSEEEKAETSAEINEMIKLLNDMSLSPLDDIKTVAGIISYWPEIMQPAPFYVFEG